MAITLVTLGHVAAGSSSGNGVTTAAANTTGGDFLIAAPPEYAVDFPLSVTDSKSNTWVPRTASPAVTVQMRLSYVASATVGSGHTGTADRTASYPSIAIAAFTGVKLVSPFDQENSNSGAWVETLDCGLLTPTQSGELILAALGWMGDISALSIAGFTILDQVAFVGSVNFGVALAHLIQTTQAPVTPTWSWTGAANAVACGATFKAEGAGPAGSPAYAYAQQ